MEPVAATAGTTLSRPNFATKRPVGRPNGIRPSKAPFVNLRRGEQKQPIWAPIRARPCRSVLQIVTAASSTINVSPTEAAVSVLHQAVATMDVPEKDVFDAIRTLEKAKLPEADWTAKLGGTSTSGWRLVYSNGNKGTQSFLGRLGKPHGAYSPFPTLQIMKWDSSAGRVENGSYLGHLAAFVFRGPFQTVKKQWRFTYDEAVVKLGPLTKSFKVDIGKEPEGKPEPFFAMIYVNAVIAVARGRGGGVALWTRTTPDWELKAGVV